MILDKSYKAEKPYVPEPKFKNLIKKWQKSIILELSWGENIDFLLRKM